MISGLPMAATILSAAVAYTILSVLQRSRYSSSDIISGSAKSAAIDADRSFKVLIRYLLQCDENLK